MYSKTCQHQKILRLCKVYTLTQNPIESVVSAFRLIEDVATFLFPQKKIEPCLGLIIRNAIATKTIAFMDRKKNVSTTL